MKTAHFAQVKTRLFESAERGRAGVVSDKSVQSAKLLDGRFARNNSLESRSNAVECRMVGVIEAFLNPRAIGIKVDDLYPDPVQVIFLIGHVKVKVETWPLLVKRGLFFRIP